MKRLLPSGLETLVLAVVALIGAAIVTRCSALDLGIAGVAIPLFITCAIRGLLRNGHLSAPESTEAE